MDEDFTKKQKRAITRSINSVTRDIMRIVNQAKIKRFKLLFKSAGSYKGHDYRTRTFFDNNAIWQISYDDTEGINLEAMSKDRAYSDSICLSRRLPKRTLYDSMWDICLDFVINYPNIRQDLIFEIEKEKRKERDHCEVIDENIELAKTKLHNLKDAIIELNFPETLDQKEIEVEKKDGQTIGTINFGERSIRIITNGDIVLVPKREKEKQKVKSNS